MMEIGNLHRGLLQLHQTALQHAQATALCLSNEPLLCQQGNVEECRRMEKQAAHERSVAAKSTKRAQNARAQKILKEVPTFFTL